MRLLAVADVHSPRYFEEFLDDLIDHSPPDLFLMAGDMVNRGRTEEFSKILDALNTSLGDGYPIIACFGNEEYAEARKRLISTADSRVSFLDEKSTILEIDGRKFGIVGTQGSLDKATSWQRRNVPNIKRVFEQRADRAASLLKGLEKRVDRKVLLMHYAPCLETCEGELERAFGWLGSRKFYKVIMDNQPDLVIHGHVHNSSRHMAMIGKSRIQNVALPAVGRLTELEI